MAERQTVVQRQQIGKETVPGTAVAATRRLASLSFSPGVQAEADVFKPQGAKYGTVQTLNKEWTQGSISGKPTFEEMPLVLAGALTAPVISQVMDGGSPVAGAYQYVYSPSTSGLDAPVTFSYEQGDDATQAEKFVHLMLTGVSLEISRSEVNLGGDFFGRSIQAGATLTPGLSLPTNTTPILPGMFSVYTAASAGLLGTTMTQLTRVVSVNPQLSDRFQPAWFVNAAQPSFTTFVENPDGPGREQQITLEADSVGMGLLPKLRDASTLFMRVEAVGPQIVPGTAASARRLTIDMALKCKNVDTWSDEDGIYAIPFTYELAHDAAWGKAIQVTMVTDQATL